MAGQAGGQAGRQEQPPKPPRTTPDETNRIKVLGQRRASRHQPASQAAASPDGRWAGRRAGRWDDEDEDEEDEDEPN